MTAPAASPRRRIPPRGRSCALMLLLLGLAVLAPARAADPEEAQYNVVVTLYNAGQWEAALKKIAEREGQNLPEPMRARYAYARAMALEKGGRADDSRQAYQAVLDKHPQSPEAVKARVALVYSDYARRDFDSLLARQAPINAGQIPAAERASFSLMLAEAHYAKGDYAKAGPAFAAALAQGADRQAAAPRLFDCHYRLQKHKELLDLSAQGVPGLESNALAAVRAEAFLALGRFPEAQAEAARVPPGSGLHPRASFTLAQALVKQGKLKEAAAPLAAAIQGLRDPPAPPAARVTLAECLLAGGRTNEADAALAEALAKAASLPEAEAAKVRQQAASLRITLAFDARDYARLAALIRESRASLPPDKLAGALYMRLYALDQQQDWRAIAAAMQEDGSIFAGTPQDGPVTLIHAGALARQGKPEAAAQALRDYLARKPAGPESTRARLELANMALGAGDFAAASVQLKAVAAAPDARATLGAEAYAQALYNQAVAALKIQAPDEALAGLQALLKASPPPALAANTWVLLGQAQAAKSNLPAAADAWKKALAAGATNDEAGVRERLGMALLAGRDAAGALAQFEAIARLPGRAGALSRDSREAWARALYAAGRYPEAAARYAELAAESRDAPALAYECAVCWERATNWAQAETWYAAAAAKKERLPAPYAEALDRNLAALRLAAGLGDRGRDYWLGQLAPAASNAAFESAASALNTVLGQGAAGAAAAASLQATLAAYAPTQARYYAVGALLLRALAGQEKPDAIRPLAARLTAEFATHEKALGNASWGATVGAAILYVCLGDAERAAGSHTDALAAYETVMAAYPYNEWPDAAACGAAECYAALGDTATALAKLQEVVNASAKNPASAPWAARARDRITTIQKGD